jgi:ATP-dependent helicase HepA
MKARACDDGFAAVVQLKDALVSADGILERERRRIDAQEQLDSMNEEVERAKIFAAELQLADEKAEVQSMRMSNWISNALQFGRIPGDVPGSFRFRYSTGGARGPRTLIDVRSFIQRCVTGIDRNESDWSAPVTALMSPDRQLVAHGRQVYPMRFGQPFVDTIYELSRQDSRGTCSAWLRASTCNEITEPTIFFGFTWLIDGCFSQSTPLERRNADEAFAPRIFRQWLDAKGEHVVQEWTLDLLTAPYGQEPKRTKRNVTYRDVRVRHDTWETLEHYFAKSDWPSLIRRTHDASLMAAKSPRTATDIAVLSKAAHLEAISAVILLRSAT